VGMDPILRDNTWKFLKDLTETGQVSVLLTTHYIHEASCADCIGFMRDGSLLVEGPPSSILGHFKDQCSNLDEIFLKICQIKSRGENFELKFEETCSEKHQGMKMEGKCNKNGIIKALLYEEFMEYRRNPL
jgi:ABC-type multidrug transport system ATPase subunit